jgi:hypothetical protein
MLYTIVSQNLLDSTSYCLITYIYLWFFCFLVCYECYQTETNSAENTSSEKWALIGIMQIIRKNQLDSSTAYCLLF